MLSKCHRDNSVSGGYAGVSFNCTEKKKKTEKHKKQAPSEFTVVDVFVFTAVFLIIKRPPQGTAKTVCVGAWVGACVGACVRVYAGALVCVCETISVE